MTAPKKSAAAEANEHTCTRRCLRWSVGFGRRWYYCADSPVVHIKVPAAGNWGQR